MRKVPKVLGVYLVFGHDIDFFAFELVAFLCDVAQITVKSFCL